MTAEEFLQEHSQISHYYDPETERMVCFADQVKQAMVEFAQHHVEQALKAASESIECYNSEQESILNAYPKENIND